MRFGAALALAIAFGVMGYGFILSAKRRRALTRAMLTSLEILRGEIATRLTPLPDCACMLAENGPGECRGFYESLYASLNALGDVEFSKLWSACLSTLDLPDTAAAALRDLGLSLGRYSADEQRAAIDRCIESLKRCSDEAGAAERSAARLRFGLALCAGALLAVILY